MLTKIVLLVMSLQNDHPQATAENLGKSMAQAVLKHLGFAPNVYEHNQLARITPSCTSLALGGFTDEIFTIDYELPSDDYNWYVIDESRREDTRYVVSRLVNQARGLAKRRGIKDVIINIQPHSAAILYDEFCMALGINPEPVEPTEAEAYCYVLNLQDKTSEVVYPAQAATA